MGDIDVSKLTGENLQRFGGGDLKSMMDRGKWE
jgi:hypothetical protein